MINKRWRMFFLWRTWAVCLLAILPVLAGGLVGVGGVVGEVVGDVTDITIADVASSDEAASEHVNFERWYSVLISDQPAGSSYMSERVVGEQIETMYQMSMSIRRGEHSISISVSSRFIETLDGTPIEATTTQQLGAMGATTNTMRFGEDTIEIISGQVGVDGARDEATKKTEEATKQKAAKNAGENVGGRKVLPAIVGEWLTPAAAGRYVAERLAAGDKQITYRSVDPAMGAMAVTMMIEVGEMQMVELLGRTVQARHCRLRSSIAPMIVTDDYLDENGRSLRSNFSVIPGFGVTLVAADRALAEQAVNPPELLASTMIAMKEPIEQPRELRRARYALTLSGEDASGLDDLPNTVVQQVAFDAARGVAMVTVDLDVTTDAEEDKQPTKPDERYLQSTTLMNHRDAKLVAMVGKATARLGDDATLLERGEVLRRYVNQVVHQKDLSVGFATASEVARTGQGDCSEHAVLLGALLRGAGIPSRLVSGVIYVEEFLGAEHVFGYHMWAQGWIDGRWVDLDATLPGDRGYDAAHIALTTSAMTEGGGMMLNDMVELTPLIGRLAIERIE